ncbi:MAG: hypothetical protein KFH87_06625 [Bacteroidetes bacterium]|nr:hypothetical protein [Bacteroidota bacterium]
MSVTTPGKNESRREELLCRIFLIAITAVLPLTAMLLWGLAYVQMWPRAIDIMGLLAISVGILGVFFFFMFLYKYELRAAPTQRRRIGLLVLHTIITLLLFLFTIWLGYDSPWRAEMIWGNYDMHTASKPWIISVLVIGSITLLGSLIDLLRSRFEQGLEND